MRPLLEAMGYMLLYGSREISQYYTCPDFLVCQQGTMVAAGFDHKYIQM